MVDWVNVLGVDLIVVIGDFIDGLVVMCWDDVVLLVDFCVFDGVYVIFGNYEYFFDYLVWMWYLMGLGMCMLLNVYVVIVKGDDCIVFVGVIDLFVF